mmetsp:Transcript_12861/g.21757  ORF Transcript_12861/g.21757 Transcript_12861/m.21757 type:complete len:91 (+) Transcript_12861:527-799(+)
MTSATLGVVGGQPKLFVSSPAELITVDVNTVQVEAKVALSEPISILRSFPQLPNVVFQGISLQTGQEQGQTYLRMQRFQPDLVFNCQEAH